MICAVAIVGVSYAYTASTENSGNGATSEYVTLSQDGAGAYKFANNLRVYYDTVNTTNSTTFTYRLSGSGNLTYDAQSYTVVKLGNDFTINANAVGRAGEDLTCSFTTTNFDVESGYCFFIVMQNTNAGTMTFQCSADDTWSSSGAFTINYDAGHTPVYDVVTVSVYYGHLAASLPSTAPAAVPLNDASITFTATSTGTNPSITFDKTSINVATGAPTQTITATLNGGLTGDITWTSSNGETATVSGTGTTGTVSIVAAGTTTITATVTSGGITYTATCLVTVSTAP